jgi:hypothetical protein
MMELVEVEVHIDGIDGTMKTLDDGALELKMVH